VDSGHRTPSGAGYLERVARNRARASRFPRSSKNPYARSRVLGTRSSGVPTPSNLRTADSFDGGQRTVNQYRVPQTPARPRGVGFRSALVVIGGLAEASDAFVVPIPEVGGIAAQLDPLLACLVADLL
jgi:hypothetical protein